MGDGLPELPEEEEEEEGEDDDSDEEEAELDPESERRDLRYLRAACRSRPLRGGLGGGAANTHCGPLSVTAAGVGPRPGSAPPERDGVGSAGGGVSRGPSGARWLLGGRTAWQDGPG